MDEDGYVMERTLGEGAFGKVYLIHDAKDRSIKHALKVIDLRTAPEEERELAVREARLLSDIDHPNILKYIDSFGRDGALCIVTEFCEGGDLSGLLEKQNGRPLPEWQIVEWFRQICSALQYMHGRRILHRDMKTQNVFLTADNRTKLGDLGLAKVLDRPNSKAVTFCGSPYYMSPEIFACKPYDSKSDIWALGVCVYEMATLERPFDAMLMHQLVFKIIHGSLPPMPTENYSKQLIDVIVQMLDKNSETRPSAEQILKDPLFKPKERPKPVSPPPRPAKPKPAPKPRMRDAMQTVMQQHKDRDGGAGGFEMSNLLETLADNRKKRAAGGAAGGGGDRPKPTPKPKKDLTSIMAGTYRNKKPGKDLEKSVKDITLKAAEPPVSDEDLSSSGSTDGGQNAMNVLQLVVRTLTGIIPQGDRDGAAGGPSAPIDDKTLVDPETMLLRQIEQLQYFCVKVMGLEEFQRAYALLESEKDEMKLEEKLIRALGEDTFAACGVQLFYLKNFEYNLHKLQKMR